MAESVIQKAIARLKFLYRMKDYLTQHTKQLLLRKGFRDTNNLIIDIFLKQKRNLKNTVVS